MKDDETLMALFPQATQEDDFSPSMADRAQPLYLVVKRQIFDAIMMGKWPAGTVLPSEVELARMLRVSVGTIRRALSELTNEGMLSRRRKTGTVVTGRTPQHSLRFFFQYFRLHGLDGSLQHSQARNLSLVFGEATDIESENLSVEPATPVMRLSRVRSVHDKPVMVETVTMPSGQLADFPRNVEDVPALLYLYLLEHYDIRISAVREKIAAELANEDDLVHLQLEAPSAVLTIEEVAYDQTGTPVLFTKHRATTRSHRYINELQ
ncbi:GntR family transcriptional regulator [Cohaesibacter haloalkalitolerans]|uniref:GntR family transcriptional regulator n=1 Tax=Cohaesibacter haloalkalitolerans TaxID=1162980 RepID=UPI001FDFB89B|nr:GntR family transcriptional regulator [Cohaesibacter haloalkalitolerans]